MILMDSGLNKETLTNMLFLDRVWNEVIVQSIPTAKAE